MKLMRYLYLDKTFKPFGEGAEINYDASTFKGGEEHVRIKNLRIDKEQVTIVSRCNSSTDVMRILMANDALKRVGGVEKIHLYIPYLPYARQDKVMVDGEALEHPGIKNSRQTLLYP